MALLRLSSDDIALAPCFDCSSPPPTHRNGKWSVTPLLTSQCRKLIPKRSHFFLAPFTIMHAADKKRPPNRLLFLVKK